MERSMLEVQYVGSSLYRFRIGDIDRSKLNAIPVAQILKAHSPGGGLNP